MAHSAEHGVDVVKDSEFCRSHVQPDHTFRLRLWREKLRWDGLPCNQPRKLVAGHLGKRLQVAHLALKILIGAVKPKALSCATVNTQRSTNGVAVPAGLQVVLLREDLDAFPLPAYLDWNIQPQGKAANVDPAIPRWERLSQECPEMSTTSALLKRGIHSVLFQELAKLDEISERILVISVDCDPLAPLRGGVDGVKADGDFPFQMAADGVWHQAEALARCLVDGPVIIMMASFPMRPVGLKGVRPPVHEEAKIICH